MGATKRIKRSGERLFALTHEFSDHGNERRFVVHATMAELLSAGPDLRERTTPVDHLPGLSQPSLRKAQEFSPNPDLSAASAISWEPVLAEKLSRDPALSRQFGAVVRLAGRGP
ncbi:MAG: hypothetical protein ABL956_02365 [Hyphomonadaceae bacterium]